MAVKFFAGFVVLVASVVASAAPAPLPAPALTPLQKGAIRFSYDGRGICGLGSAEDPFGAQVTSPDRPMALVLAYRVGEGEWADLSAAKWRMEADADLGIIRYTLDNATAPLKVVQSFKTDGAALEWNIELESTGDQVVTVGDLAIQVPSVGPRGEEPKQIFERGFVKHQFISGDGSFLYFIRANGVPPFMMVTVRPGTHLEYFSGGRGGSQVFVHSARSGSAETRGTWRQPHTSLTLKPEARKASYGFRFQFGKSYDELRQALFNEGLFDIRTVPGMTIPEDLTARFALHTKAHIDSIEAEFPQQTKIVERASPQNGYRVYEVTFKRLGENKLTIHHDGGRKTYLEYFVTESLETVIKKRSAFIAGRQQIRDPSKWYDGVYGPYDMRNKVVRTVDDPDIFTGRMVYVLTCDDPGLCKAPFIASKNVAFPDAKEIESLEYYLEHFVWGKMQRTDKEEPYPYGVYGTPEWHTNRDPELRAKKATRDLEKMHVWRSYDYPHVVMLYYHMYEIAKKYPQMSKYLDSAGYLERAWQTARAFFIYPYEIYPSYYETYKWGLYNELVVLKVADALEREGFADRAAWIRAEWEKKVKYFVYDDPYPYRSEYAFDRTAFESTYAFAKYGATRDMKPDKDLWYDVRLKKSYSHPVVQREDSRAFMDRQLFAGLCVRGWLETSYYQLGADGSMSYMAAMGGWGILDYGLNFAPKPADWLQLGYASYLSSWSLVNSGRADTNYGYWFPGKENDGAAGWQFMSSKFGSAWMGAEVPRGPWHYDGEIDLGFGGALRMAATILTRDPVFGWTCYGGTMATEGEGISMIPRDGLRQRFAAILPGANDSGPRRFKLEVGRDGFAAEKPIVTDQGLSKLTFTLENRTGDEHATTLSLSVPAGEEYEVVQDGRKVSLNATTDWDYPLRGQLQVKQEASKVEIIRRAASN